jgi:hypothetical protein
VDRDRPSADRLLECLERPAGSSRELAVRIFVIFDTEHDGDLYALLRAQSNSLDCGFSVMGGSEVSRGTEAARARVRDQIREADQAIVICGEHTEASPDVHAEFLIAIEEETPYFLLWGRRGVMCTKPIGATRVEGMYSWTGQILHDQIAFNLRRSNTEAKARSLRRVTRDGRTLPYPTATPEAINADPATAHTVR